MASSSVLLLLVDSVVAVAEEEIGAVEEALTLGGGVDSLPSSAIASKWWPFSFLFVDVVVVVVAAFAFALAFAVEEVVVVLEEGIDSEVSTYPISAKLLLPERGDPSEDISDVRDLFKGDLFPD